MPSSPYIKHTTQTQKNLTPHGISLSHAEAFLQVANNFDCIIMVRSPGPYALGLIAENYSTKGYFNKAKTSNWGPMAGFVLDDPFLSKLGLEAGGEERQFDYLRQAKRAGCTKTPLIISETRVQELLDANVIKVANAGDKKGIIYQATLCEYGTNKSVKGSVPLIRSAKGYRFQLREVYDRKSDEFETKYYHVYYAQPQKGYFLLQAIVDQRHGIKGAKYAKYKKLEFPDLNFRMATISDYDLFAVWQRVPRARYDHELSRQQSSQSILNMQANNQRPVSAMDAKSGVNLENEYTDSGNSKDFIRNTVRPALNEAFECDMIHHSDEAGRPMVSEIAFPIVVFLPQYAFGDNRMIGYINNKDEFLSLYQEASNKFLVDLNQGWIDQLSKDAKSKYRPQQNKVVQSMSTRTISGAIDPD